MSVDLPAPFSPEERVDFAGEEAEVDIVERVAPPAKRLWIPVIFRIGAVVVICPRSRSTARRGPLQVQRPTTTRAMRLLDS